MTDRTQDAADWSPVRRGLVCLLGGTLVFALGVVLTVLGLFVVASSWTGRAAPPGSEKWFVLAGVGGVFALIGALVRLLGMFWLAGIPPAAGAGRWASWGVLGLPLAVPGPAYQLYSIGDPQAGGGHIPAFAAWLLFLTVVLCGWSFCISHILRTAAGYWGDPALRRRFRLSFVAAWCLSGAWVAYMTASSFSEVSLYPGPFVLLGPMGWDFVLHRRLLRRIPGRGGVR